MSATAQVLRRTVTELDHVRIYNMLTRLYGSATAPQAEELGDVIDNADVVRAQEVGPEVVTMYTQVRVADGPDAAERTITLVYPQDADAAQGKISVLSPIGTGLLGLSIGDVARWHGVDGKESSVEVRGIEFQPEASGDYTA